MMPQEWPIAAPAAERSAHARVASRGRLATVRLDFFLDPAERLTEQERALMTAMLHCLVGDIAAEIRAALPSGWTGANDDESALVETLARTGLLDEAGLMGLLLRRADEERIGTAARGRSGRYDGRAVQGLVSHHDGEVSAAAMGLILARGRRRDRFGQCLAAFDDLPGEAAERLVYAVAGALRDDAASAHGAAAADWELSRAASALAGKHEAARGIEALTGALVAALERAAALSEELLLGCAQEGEVRVLGHAIGHRAGIAGDVALDELLSGSAQRVMGLLRLGGFSRELSAGLLASAGDLLGIEDAGGAIGIFEAMTNDEVEATANWLAAPARYRAALQALGQSHG